MRSNWTEQGQLVRFNIGLEDVADLIADIEQALAKMNTNALILRLTRSVVEGLEPETIVLFGSKARGEAQATLIALSNNW